MFYSLHVIVNLHILYIYSFDKDVSAANMQQSYNINNI